MAALEGYNKLATIGIAYKGDYNETVQYSFLNAVYYQGSTYIALKDSPAGTPKDDRLNWKFLAKGFVEQDIASLMVVDTEGIAGEPGKQVDAQTFLDALVNDEKTGDSSERTIDFTSGDEAKPEEWKEIPLLKSGEKHTSLFQKISNMFSNIRYLSTHSFEKGDILDSLEEIMANQESGRTAGALAVKNLNNSLNSHVNNKSNPHSVTPAQIGLGNVNNTADANKNVRSATIAGYLGSGANINSNKIYFTWTGYELQCTVDSTMVGTVTLTK